MLCLSGCVKMNAGMTINKDKSMDFEMLMSVNKEYMSDSDFNKNMLLDDENIDKMKENGFTIHDYNQNDMVGYKIAKKFENIDEISSTDEVEFNFDDIYDESDNMIMFKVKKGILRDTYTANFTNINASSFDGSSSGNNFGNNGSSFDDENWNMDELKLSSNNKYGVSPLATNGNNDFDFSDMAGMMASMEATFTVKLPYGAINTNATSLNNDGKDLSWNMMNSDLKNISFEFYVYNLPVIYSFIVVGVALIAFLIYSSLKNKKGPKAMNVVATTPVNNEPHVGQTIEGLGVESVPGMESSPVTSMPANNANGNINDGLFNSNTVMAETKAMSTSPVVDLSMPSDDIRQVESVPQVSLNEQIVQNKFNGSNGNTLVEEPVNSTFDQGVNNQVESLENLGQNVVQNDIRESSNVIQPKPVQQSLFLEIEEPNNNSVDGNNGNGQLQ